MILKKRTLVRSKKVEKDLRKQNIEVNILKKTMEADFVKKYFPKGEKKNRQLYLKKIEKTKDFQNQYKMVKEILMGKNAKKRK